MKEYFHEDMKKEEKKNIFILQRIIHLVDFLTCVKSKMSKIQIEMDMFSLGGKVVGFIVTKRKKQNGDVRRNDTRDTFFFFFKGEDQRKITLKFSYHARLQ